MKCTSHAATEDLEMVIFTPLRATLSASPDMLNYDKPEAMIAKHLGASVMLTRFSAAISAFMRR